jgi:hypothetical protein
MFAGMGGRHHIFDQVLPVADPDDVAFVRALFRGGVSGKDGLRGLGRLGPGRFQEALRKSGARATRVIEAVGLQYGAELVPSEDAEEGRDAKLARVEERADLILFLGFLADRNPELAAESDQTISRQGLEQAPFGEVRDLHLTAMIFEARGFGKRR